jgi:hypothetical protein
MTVYSFTIVPSAAAVALVRLTGYRARGPLCALAAELGYPEPDPNTLTSQLRAYGYMLAVESTADGPFTETATYGAWRGLVATHVRDQLQVTAANARAAKAARRQEPEGILQHTDPTPSTPQSATMPMALAGSVVPTPLRRA